MPIRLAQCGALLLFVGCQPDEEYDVGPYSALECDGLEWVYEDADGDGFGNPLVTVSADCADSDRTWVRDGSDCNDEDSIVNPGSSEWCDGHDNDCNGKTDDGDPGRVGGTPFYIDRDGDGFGDANQSLVRCSAPSGYSSSSDDCDDSDPDVHGPTTWREDVDGDGMGSDVIGEHCDSLPASAPAEAGYDCDDTDPTIYEGAPEICRDGIDQDCDGVDDRCWSSGDMDMQAEAAAWVHGAADSEVGRSATSGDLTGDGQPDLVVTAFGEGGGTVYLWPGPVSGELDPASAVATIIADSINDDGVGEHLLAADISGDAQDDLIVACPACVPSAVFLLHGPFAGPITLDDTVVRVSSAGLSDGLGYDVALVGDSTGDGIGDVLVGSDGEGAYLVAGPGSPGVNLVDAVTHATFVGENLGDGAGQGVLGPGDMDGDGQPDFLIGSPYGDYGDPNAGSVYLALGPVAGTVNLADADARLDGYDDDTEVGGQLAMAGDVDGDGRQDAWAVGRYAYWNDVDHVFLVSGPPSGVGDVDDAPVEILGAYNASTTVAGGEDLDGDGALDLVLSVHYAREMFIVWGPLSGVIDAPDSDTSYFFSGYGNAPDVLTMGTDLTGDGLMDLVAASSAVEPTGLWDQGAAWVLPGGL